MNRTAVRVKTMPVRRIWTGRERTKGGRKARYGSSSYLKWLSKLFE